jgi:outer membrane receptor protein involved in Fe transport
MRYTSLPWARQACLLFFIVCLSNPASAQTAGSPATPPPDSDEEPLQLSVFDVTTSRDEGYGSTYSVGGSRVNLPIQEIPSSIVSLNEQFLKDVGALEVNDAINYVSGIATADGAQYSLRGYAQQGVNYRDGLPDREIGLNTATNDAGGFQRIEVIKGPAGVLYGAHSMGGIVNRVSKVPLGTQQTNIQLGLSTGWDQFVRGVVDTTGPLKDTGISYRLVLVDREGEKAWGGKDRRQSMIGTVSYDFGKKVRNRVWLRYSFLINDATSEQGLNFVDKDAKLAPFFAGGNRDYTNFPLDSWATQHTRSWELGYRASTHALGGEWTVRLLGRANFNWGDKLPAMPEEQFVPSIAMALSWGQMRLYPPMTPGSPIGDLRLSLEISIASTIRPQDMWILSGSTSWDPPSIRW